MATEGTTRATKKSSAWRKTILPIKGVNNISPNGAGGGNNLRHEKNPSYFPLNPGWLIGILIMVYYNAYITG